METNLVAMQRGTLAMVDVARSTVNILSSLPGENSIAGPTAASIQNASVFVEQSGGEMFSGVAGGLMREWELGSDPDQADLFFELIGQLRIPALFNSATQFTYQNVGDDWMMMLRSGSNFPDATAMAESMGLALPLDELVGAAIGQSQENFAGWMGVADEEPYLQVFAKRKFKIQTIEFNETTLSGYVDDLSAGDLQQKFANMDFGICAEVEQAVIPPGNPYISLFTMGQTPVITMGGYMQKRDEMFSMGFKSGFAVDVTVPLIPVVGVRSGIDIGGFGEMELDGTWFPDMQLGGCARPYVSGSLFGIELGEVSSTIDFALFGDIDDPDAEAGMKMRLRIAEEQYDTMRENLSCSAPPGPIEWTLCSIVDLAGEDLGAWMTLTPDGVYFGLGRFPNNGEDVLFAPLLADGGVGVSDSKRFEAGAASSRKGTSTPARTTSAARSTRLRRVRATTTSRRSKEVRNDPPTDHDPDRLPERAWRDLHRRRAASGADGVECLRRRRRSSRDPLADLAANIGSNGAAQLGCHARQIEHVPLPHELVGNAQVVVEHPQELVIPNLV